MNKLARSLQTVHGFAGIRLQATPKAFGVGPTASPRRVPPVADEMAVQKGEKSHV
jgi:hypothetical protein